MIHG
jgi:hypothetical protein